MQRYFCPILAKFGVSTQIFVKPPGPNINFTKIRPVGAALTYAGKQT